MDKLYGYKIIHIIAQSFYLIYMQLTMAIDEIWEHGYMVTDQLREKHRHGGNQIGCEQTNNLDRLLKAKCYH